MKIVNIHEAKTHLSRLVDEAANGNPFLIAKSGNPLVRVAAVDTPAAEERRRLGFLAGEFVVPDDFDEMGAHEIAHLFGGQST